MHKHLALGLSIAALVPVLALAQTPSDTPPAGTSSCLSLTHNMGYRATDATTEAEVSALQDFLNAKGYLSVAPTGFYGILTTEAVKQFQAANGVDSTGYTGPYTRAKVLQITCSTAATGSSTSGSSNTSSGTANTSGSSNTTSNTNPIVIPVGSPYSGTYQTYTDLVNTILRTAGSGITYTGGGTGSTGAGAGTTAGGFPAGAPKPIPSKCYGRNVISIKEWDANAKGDILLGTNYPPDVLDFVPRQNTAHIVGFRTANGVYYSGSVLGAHSQRAPHVGVAFLSSVPCDITTAAKKKDGKPAIGDSGDWYFISAPQTIFDQIQNDTNLMTLEYGRYTPSKYQDQQRIVRLEPNSYYYVNFIDDAAARDMFGLDEHGNVKFDNPNFDPSPPPQDEFSVGIPPVRFMAWPSAAYAGISSRNVIPGYTNVSSSGSGSGSGNGGLSESPNGYCPIFFTDGSTNNCMSGGNAAQIKAVCCPGGTILSCTATSGGVVINGTDCVYRQQVQSGTWSAPTNTGRGWASVADSWAGFFKTAPSRTVGSSCVPRDEVYYYSNWTPSANGGAAFICTTDPSHPTTADYLSCATRGGCCVQADKYVQTCN